MSSIFQRAGGFAVVRHIVSDFYGRVVGSPAIGHHFKGIDLRRMIDHQTKFVAAMMGGPAAFDDQHLQRAHRHLGIRPEEFAEMANLLEATLQAHSLPAADIAEVLRQIRSREPLIVGADPRTRLEAAA